MAGRQLQGQSGAGMVPMYICRPQTGISDTARLFLLRRTYLEGFEHEMRDHDAYILACRVKEDAAFLIGYCA